MSQWQVVDVDNFDFLKLLGALKLRNDLMARVVHWQLAKRRSGTHETKMEADVRGSGKKIFRQKGTGNARQGARRAPHMRGGAIIFGPHNRDYGYSLPKKIRALGLMHALASVHQKQNLKVFKNLALDTYKTKDVVTTLKEMFGEQKILFVTDEDNLKMAIRNVHGVDVLPVGGLNVYDILKHDVLVLSEDAINGIQERVRSVC